MNQRKLWLGLLSCSLAIGVSFTANAKPEDIALTNRITLNGNRTDLSAIGSRSANVNRLGGFFSDLYYDRVRRVYYGLVDRGPGGGLINYNTRVQKFTVDVSRTGKISNFRLLDTIFFTKGNKNFNGLNPSLLNGNSTTLGLSFDSEGLVVAPNGNFYVADEYGPSVYEFKPNGSFVRAFQTPSNLIPLAGKKLDYVDGTPTITNGRQDNRGFEGLAIAPNGKLYAILQDPLVNEGLPDGRYSRNLRIVEFDPSTGTSNRQYIYTLESIDNINQRLAGTENDFASKSQGRNIGVSAIVALNNRQFLVLERDNRGIGVEDPQGELPVGSKRIYKIDISKATNVSNIPLTKTNTLPANVTSVSKTLYLDIAQALRSRKQIVPEKIEGLTIGPKLADGAYAILLGTDNDFSVTQTGSGTQLDVCTNGTQVKIDAFCPQGAILPSYLYSFKASNSALASFVP